MSYSWDPKKNRWNIARHGIAFEDAMRVFEGPTLEKWIIVLSTGKFACMPLAS